MNYLMKFLLALVLLNISSILCAEDEARRDPLENGKKVKFVQDPLIIRALGGLAKRMDIQFNIPFPVNFDVDTYMKRPMAIITVGNSKVYATRPIVNPYDQPQTVEWMMGPPDSERFSRGHIFCQFDLDNQGDFERLNLMADWSSDGGNHQVERADGESVTIFLERAHLTYQDRAKKDKDPAAAQLYLEAFEKLATAIQKLRKEVIPSAPQPSLPK